MPMTLTTDALNEKGFFDLRYTCDLDNSSPELRWQDPPADTVSFALIMEDRDAPGGPFIHWVVYNIPPDINHLPAGIPPQDSLPNGIRQGVNGAKKLGYAGPCPPDGDPPHHYAFTLYALRGLPEIMSRATAEQLLTAIKSLIIESTQLVGLYERMRQAVQRAG